MSAEMGWRLRRTTPGWIPAAAPYVRAMKETAEEAVIRLTGGQVTVNHGPKILWWKGERPEAYARIARFVPAFRLCGDAAVRLDGPGRVHRRHPSAFHRLCRQLEPPVERGASQGVRVAAEKMPAIRRPAERIGTLTKEMAAAAACRRGYRWRRAAGIRQPPRWGPGCFGRARCTTWRVPPLSFPA